MSLVWKDKIWFWLLGGKWPEEKGYTIIDGYIDGVCFRCESFDGGEIWVTYSDYKSIPGVSWGSRKNQNDGLAGFFFNNMKPFERDGKIWSVSPIQKKSYQGYLKTYPKSFWYWNMRKLQSYYTEYQYGKPVDVWKPGTEDGICFRSTPCWRIDFPGTTLDGKLRHWIPSGGHLSFKHYD